MDFLISLIPSFLPSFLDSSSSNSSLFLLCSQLYIYALFLCVYNSVLCVCVCVLSVFSGSCLPPCSHCYVRHKLPRHAHPTPPPTPHKGPQRQSCVLSCRDQRSFNRVFTVSHDHKIVWQALFLTQFLHAHIETIQKFLKYAIIQNMLFFLRFWM